MGDEHDSWFKPFGFDPGEFAAAAVKTVQNVASTVVEEVKGVVQKAENAVSSAVKTVAGAAGAAGGASPAAGASKSGGSVGQGGQNNLEDVKAVQAALNSRAGAGLAVDGKCGGGTIAAIKAFQKSIGQANPDGRIDPGGATSRALAGAASALAQQAGGSGGLIDQVLKGAGELVEDAKNLGGRLLSGDAKGDDGGGGTGPSESEPEDPERLEQSAQAGDIEAALKRAGLFERTNDVIELLPKAGVPDSDGVSVRITIDSALNVTFQVTTKNKAAGKKLEGLLKEKFGNAMKAAIKKAGLSVSGTVVLQWLTIKPANAAEATSNALLGVSGLLSGAAEALSDLLDGDDEPLPTDAQVSAQAFDVEQALDAKRLFKIQDVQGEVAPLLNAAGVPSSAKVFTKVTVNKKLNATITVSVTPPTTANQGAGAKLAGLLNQKFSGRMKAAISEHFKRKNLSITDTLEIKWVKFE